MLVLPWNDAIIFSLNYDIAPWLHLIRVACKPFRIKKMARSQWETSESRINRFDDGLRNFFLYI